MNCSLPIEASAYNACKLLDGSCIGNVRYTGNCLRCILGGSNGFYTFITIMSAYIGTSLIGTIGSIITWKWASYISTIVPILFIICECFALVMQGCKISIWHTTLIVIETAILTGMRLPAFLGKGSVILALFSIIIGICIGFIPIYNADSVLKGWYFTVPMNFVFFMIQITISSLRIPTFINNPIKYKNVIKRIVTNTGFSNTNITIYSRQYLKEATMSSVIYDALYDYWGDNVGWCLILIPYLTSFGIYEVQHPFVESLPKPIYTIFKFRYILAAIVLGIKVVSVFVVNILVGKSLSNCSIKDILNRVITKKIAGTKLVITGTRSYIIRCLIAIIMIPTSILTLPASLLEFTALMLGKIFDNNEFQYIGALPWYVMLELIPLEPEDSELCRFTRTMSPLWCYKALTTLIHTQTIDINRLNAIKYFIKLIKIYSLSTIDHEWNLLADKIEHSFEESVDLWQWLDNFFIENNLDNQAYIEYTKMIRVSNYKNIQIIIWTIIYKLKQSKISLNFEEAMCTLDLTRLEWELWLDMCYDLSK